MAMDHELTDVGVTITLDVVVPYAAIPGVGLERLVQAWGSELGGVLSEDVKTTLEASGLPGNPHVEMNYDLRHAAEA